MMLAGYTERINAAVAQLRALLYAWLGGTVRNLERAAVFKDVHALLEVGPKSAQSVVVDGCDAAGTLELFC